MISLLNNYETESKSPGQEALWAPVGQDCLEFPFTFDIVTDRMKSLCKHFNPGVIVSCDQYANIGLQRSVPNSFPNPPFEFMSRYNNHPLLSVPPFLPIY